MTGSEAGAYNLLGSLKGVQQVALSIYKVGVVGGGIMGRGIAQLCAYSGGLPVVVKEVSKEMAEKSHSKIQATLTKLAEKGKSKAEIAKNLITVTDKWEDFADADLLIEAVVENMSEKQNVFAEAALHLPSHALMASNTSALPLGKMMEKVTPELHGKFAGLHFFNPPHQLKLVELIRSEKTSEETLVDLEDFSKNTIGRTVIKVKECPGFLVNRLLMPYLNEAAILLLETGLTPEEIDSEAQSFGWPLGPFMLLDMLGIDVAAEVAKVLHEGYGERAKPSSILNKLVELKRFGVKSESGFYGEPSIVNIINEHFPFSRQRKVSAAEGFHRMMMAFANEAFLCLEENIASAEDIEIGCREGLGFPPVLEGPLHWVQNMGFNEFADSLAKMNHEHAPRFPLSVTPFKMPSGNQKLFEEGAW